MARIKTAVTLEKELLDWIDAKVKEGVFSSRSHAIRYALLQLMKKKD
jgi:Arc/MetJ-type ribon-helix-helix transcriptional regulator